jgi:hypothetical protein
MDTRTCDAINSATESVVEDLLGLGKAFVTVPLRGENKGILLLCCDEWRKAIQPILQQQGIELAYQTFGDSVAPLFTSTAFLEKGGGRFNDTPKTAFKFSLNKVPQDAEALLDLLHLRGSKRRKVGSKSTQMMAQEGCLKGC